MHNTGTYVQITPLTQTASSTMEKAGLDINILYAGKLDPVTGRQTLADTLTDAASTSQFEVLPKMAISFPYLENMSLQLSIIEL
jgi:septin family protein